jgi:hypothetical protein
MASLFLDMKSIKSPAFIADKRVLPESLVRGDNETHCFGESDAGVDWKCRLKECHCHVK